MKKSYISRKERHLLCKLIFIAVAAFLIFLFCQVNAKAEYYNNYQYHDGPKFTASDEWYGYSLQPDNSIDTFMMFYNCDWVMSHSKYIVFYSIDEVRIDPNYKAYAVITDHQYDEKFHNHRYIIKLKKPGKLKLNMRYDSSRPWEPFVGAEKIILKISKNSSKYTVRFDGNGATSGSMQKKSYRSGYLYRLPANKYKRTNYEFIGWKYYLKEQPYKQNDYMSYSWIYRDKGEFHDLSMKNGGTVTLYAEWMPITYYIEFSGNKATSGTMPATYSKQYYAGKSYKLPTNKYKRKGYKFVGWNTKADGSGKAYANQATIKNLTKKNRKVVKLYAQWKKVKYTITYNLNGGTNNAQNLTSYYVTSPNIPLYKPTRKGYAFEGWYTDSACSEGNRIDNIPHGSTGNKTLYAKWVPKSSSISKATVKLSGLSGADSAITYEAYYDDKLFSNDSSEVDTQLLKLSALMAEATYNSGQVEKIFAQCDIADHTLIKTGPNNSDSTVDDNDHARVELGHKSLSDGRILIVAAVNGYTTGGYEWISNFNVGTGITHVGFDNAAEEIASAITLYINEHAKGYSSDQIVLWFTGHSRGGAVANLAAIRLMQGTGLAIIKDGVMVPWNLKVKRQNMYVYCFATPQYTKDKTNYTNLQNFVSPHDFVPNVVPTSWNFRRQEPTKHQFEDSNLTSMKVSYKKLKGTDYNGLSTSKRITLVDEFDAVGVSQSEYSVKKYYDSNNRKISAETYAKTGIGYAMTKDDQISMVGATNILLGYHNSAPVNAPVDILSLDIIINGKIDTKIGNSHEMVAYLAWLEAEYPGGCKIY